MHFKEKCWSDLIHSILIGLDVTHLFMSKPHTFLHPIHTYLPIQTTHSNTSIHLTHTHVHLSWSLVLSQFSSLVNTLEFFGGGFHKSVLQCIHATFYDLQDCRNQKRAWYSLPKFHWACYRQATIIDQPDTRKKTEHSTDDQQ